MRIIGYLKFGIYMINMSIFKKMKLKRIKKNQGQEAAIDYCAKVGEDFSKFVMNKVLKVKLEVVGKENIPKEACCFIGNHTSMLDVPILIESVGKAMGFIAKKETMKNPLLAIWVREYVCVALDRENAREAIKSIREGAENIKNGYSMAIFPEGTRSKDGKLLEFKKGSLKLATMAKAPIVPVTIEGAYKVLDGKNKEHDTIKVTFSEPIYTDNLTREEEKGLMDKVRGIIAQNLNQE